MNRKRREKLSNAIDLLKKASSIIDEARDEEQDCLDNTPENLEGSDRYCAMEDAIDNLDDSMTAIEEAIDKVEDASI